MKKWTSKVVLICNTPTNTKFIVYIFKQEVQMDWHDDLCVLCRRTCVIVFDQRSFDQQFSFLHVWLFYVCVICFFSKLTL